MQARKLRRFGVGAVIALLVCQASAAWGSTVAWWRFKEGPPDGNVLKGGLPDGTFFPGVADDSGNGNTLSAWSEGGYAGYAYKTEVAAATIPQTGDANAYSVQNTGGVPGMFTQTGAPIQTITPTAFTIEAVFKPEVGGHRTFVGRDSQGAISATPDLAALYLQAQPDNSMAIKFADVSGYWHEAISAPGLIRGFQFPDTATGHWYAVAAVSDGNLLSLYVNDVSAGTGYQLAAQTDMTTSGSTNRALTAGTGDGADWDPGNWSVGRGLFGGGHTDRGFGLIDEVRISDSALDPGEFLFTPPQVTLWPAAIEAATVDAPATLTLVVPVTCHSSEPLDVTVTSDNPAVAKPVGTSGSKVVHYDVGGSGMQLFTIEYGAPGTANFTVSASGCTVGPQPALTVNVHGLQSVSIQAPYDIMTVGQTQQATVTATFDSLTRNVSAASFGTTYDATPAGVVSISPDGLITAVGSGTAVITATFGGITTPQLVVAAMPAGHTVAYWRFEEGPVNTDVPHPIGDGQFYISVPDASGNGNHLSTWTQGGCCGYAYRTDRGATTIPETHAANNFSVQNTGGGPGMFTQTGAPIQTISPAAFTIEVSFKPETGGWRTIIGRDSRGAATTNPDLAALYLQITPEHALAIKFADVSGYWHEAVSGTGLIQGFQYPNTSEGHWYHAAAVSDGSILSLYVNDVDAGTGYQLVAQKDIAASGSPNTALTPGMGDGGDWDAGNWTVGRGLYAGGHGDRAYGFIDEVRISDVALDPSQFLFSSDAVVLWPNALTMAPVDTPVVSLVIPTTCNESQPVDVTVTSDNPSVARPAGTTGSTVVHFPAGAGRLQPVTIESSGPGVAYFTLSATGSCPTGNPPALAITVQAAQAVALQADYDIMYIGQTQQAKVIADFGLAGTRNVAAASTGTTYNVTPAGVITVGPDGLITAVGLGSAAVTATYAGFTSPAQTIVVAIPNAQPRPKIAGSGILLVDLAATDLTAGQATWVNKGSLGDFAAIGTPVVGTVADQLAVTFDATAAYQGPSAPVELLGGQGRSIEVWAYNPAMDGTAPAGERIENMVSWGYRGGPDGSLLVFSFGEHPGWGAVGQWGTGKDMPWSPAGGSPPLGQWRHLVYTFDPTAATGTTTLFDNGVQVNSAITGPMPTHEGHIDLCVQNLSANPMNLFTDERGIMSMAAVRVHDGALTPDEVMFNYLAGPTGHGLIRPDLNLDTKVDATDVSTFAACLTGPGVPAAGDCVLADFDDDRDVDQDDFGILQRCYNGDTPAVVGCE